MNIVKATHRFEEWLGRHTTLVQADLRLKHQRMAEAISFSSRHILSLDADLA